MAVALRGGNCQQPEHQIRAGHPPGFFKIMAAAVGRQRPAVGQHHHRTVLNLPVFLVLAGSHGGVDIGNADVLAPPVFQLAFHQRHGFFHVRHRDPDSQNIGGVEQAQPHRSEAADQIDPAPAAQIRAEAGHQQDFHAVFLADGDQLPQSIRRNIFLHGNELFDVQLPDAPLQPVKTAQIVRHGIHGGLRHIAKTADLSVRILRQRLTQPRRRGAGSHQQGIVMALGHGILHIEPGQQNPLYQQHRGGAEQEHDEQQTAELLQPENIDYRGHYKAA